MISAFGVVHKSAGGLGAAAEGLVRRSRKYPKAVRPPLDPKKIGNPMAALGPPSALREQARAIARRRA